MIGSMISNSLGISATPAFTTNPYVVPAIANDESNVYPVDRPLSVLISVPGYPGEYIET